MSNNSYLVMYFRKRVAPTQVTVCTVLWVDAARLTNWITNRSTFLGILHQYPLAVLVP